MSVPGRPSARPPAPHLRLGALNDLRGFTGLCIICGGLGGGQRSALPTPVLTPARRAPAHLDDVLLRVSYHGRELDQHGVRVLGQDGGGRSGALLRHQQLLHLQQAAPCDGELSQRWLWTSPRPPPTPPASSQPYPWSAGGG